MVEFSDFECPFCAKVQPVLKGVLAQFEGKVRHIWKDYPLPIHANAMTAAMAARCAGEQGMFWKYHDLLFANQKALEERALKDYARALDLDTRAFDACLDGDKYRAEITASLKAASSYPVPATPTVFINGRIVTGVAPVDVYTRIIGEELGN
jgi:protein-disulfide isomerase